MNCLDCTTYRLTKGRGSKGCLRCANYRDFQKKFTVRDRVPYMLVPDEILENIEDDIGIGEGGLLQTIQKMPIELSMVLTLHYMSGMSKREIARECGRSERTVRRMIASAERLLREMLRG